MCKLLTSRLRNHRLVSVIPVIRLGGQMNNSAQSGAAHMGGVAHAIVLGNEKGGSGKTTTAMHVIALLLHEGAKVGSIDLDGRQRSLTRYVENRKAWADGAKVNLVMPDHVVLPRSELGSVAEAQAAERAAFEEAFTRLAVANDFIVIDCPGTDSFLSRLGHAVADTLITPMNDSFVDFDLLGRVDPQSWKIKGPSVYAEMVWEARKRRLIADGGEIDWIVIRNRLSTLAAKNKRRVEGVRRSLIVLRLKMQESKLIQKR